MRKIRPGLKKEEYLKRYIESAVVSAIRRKRYLMEYKKLPEELATANAITQAVGMIASGGFKNAENLLKEIEEISSKLREEINFNCICCPSMPSLNLFRRDDIRKEEAGGELYILNYSLTSSIGKAIYHNAGELIGCLEDILLGLHKSLLNKSDIIHAFLWHSIRDLKASLFFAFCGRYRQALFTLRSALELLFTGFYFQNLKKDRGNKEKLKEEWEIWSKGKNFFGKGKTVIKNKNLEEKSGKLYGKFSQAAHVFVKDEYEMVTVKDKPLARPASAFFEPEFLKEWFDDFIQLISLFDTLILEVVSTYNLRETKRSKKGLHLLKSILQELREKDRREKILDFVNCPILNKKENKS